LLLLLANSNNFTGTIPDLTKLVNLYEIDVSNNQLSGLFPKHVLDVPLLSFLDLRYNVSIMGMIGWMDGKGVPAKL
jgi:Leucine-rich repeat (LRR) protein